MAEDIARCDREGENYLIMVTFSSESSLGSDYHFKERGLSQEDPEDAPEVPIGIDGIQLSGYLVSLFLLAIFMIGTCCLFGVQSPTHFSKTHFVVGRES